MKTLLEVQNGDTLGAVQNFLARLLEAGEVEALLVPMRTSAGTVTPALVADPALLKAADPLAPVLPVNGATLAGKVSAREPRVRIGVVLRSCELRALVELSKMQQACLDSLLLIAVDCAGTYSVPAYVKGGSADGWRALYEAAVNEPGAPQPALRLACQVCEQPVFTNAAIRLHLLESDLETEVRLTLPDALGEKLGFTPQDAPASPVVERLQAARLARREAEFAALRQKLDGGSALAGGASSQNLAHLFAACIRCHNCMNVCPICYCKVCVFKSPVFDHDPMQYVTWARQKGACRMPADTVLFHLTRMNHMALSCVGCGMCTEACPAELPVGLAFRLVGGQLQSTFDYHPGLNPADPLPLVTFKADEWTEVGE